MIVKLPILIKTDGTITEITPENEKDFKLAELSKAIECNYVEMIYLKNETSSRELVMVGDDEGRLHEDSAINEYASLLYEMCWDKGIPPENSLTRMLAVYDAETPVQLSTDERFNIYGNIIVCKSGMIK